MELMQFTAVVLMIGLTMKLFLLPRRVEENVVTRKCRWLMLGGTTILGVQFFLQYMLGLRAMGVTQGVMLNLALFPLAAWMMALAVYRLLKRGKVSRADTYLGGVVWLTVLALMVLAKVVSGEPLLSDTPQMRLAEKVGSVLYMLMQFHYCARQMAGLRRIRHSLADYYDYDMSHLLVWMQISIFILDALALFVPAVIFFPGPWLAFFAIVFFFGTWYLVDSFCDYLKSSMPRKIQEAEESNPADDEDDRDGVDDEAIGEEAMIHADAAIARWIEQGNYRNVGLKMPDVAGQMDLPYYLLRSWLRRQNLKFSDWMAGLRVEEAKRIIREHPSWTNETIASRCGFRDRTAFQRKFKDITGMTPADFAS